MKEYIYITTPIYYPNSTPHIGTAYTTIAADVLTRFYKMQNKKVFFLTGTDEHGEKLEKTAKAKNIEVIEYINSIVSQFKQVWQNLNINYDDFIRTTQERHIETVKKVIKKLIENGDIYKDKYEGWYCYHCETYWPNNQVGKDKLCPNPQCKRPLEVVQEESFFFKLSKYEKKLLNYYKENPDSILPKSRYNETISFIQHGLQDLSISRKTVKWGIQIPENEEFTLYVWIDALINYISAIGYLQDEDKFKKFWPADVHIIGKDILRFHTIIWPAMLMALNLPLPKLIFAHGWLVQKGSKISKSKGAKNINELIELFSADPIRYTLLKEGRFGEDIEFSEDIIKERLNKELANEFGNLINRTLSMIKKYQNYTIIKVENSNKEYIKEFLDITNALPDKLEEKFKTLNFRQVLLEIWNLVIFLNQLIEKEKPWQLNKEGKKDELSTLLYYLIEGIRISSACLYPFMPQSIEKVFSQLNLPLTKENLSINKLIIQDNHKIAKEFTPIFKKIDK